MKTRGGVAEVAKMSVVVGMGRAALPLLVLVLLQLSRAEETFGEACVAKFNHGKPGFVLDLDDSVKYGASFLAPGPATRWRDCVRACCKHPRCNLAMVEKTPDEELIKGCFLMDCLYKQAFVCRFFRKEGFANYISTEIYDTFLKEKEHDDGDRLPVAKPGLNQIVQPNQTVILTGRESKDDFGIEKYHWELVSGDPSVQMKNTDDPMEYEVSDLKAGQYVFKLTVTDTVGQEDSATVNITVLMPEQSVEFCLAPQKVGPCRGSFPRWSYDSEQQKCEKFTFGGCKGNRNNYLSEEECDQACQGYLGKKPTNRRLPPPDCSGSCRSLDFRCSDGCCIRGGQECDGVAHCKDGSDETFCKNIDDGFRRVLEINITKDKVHCVDPPVTGPCKASFPRWYYDPYSRQCNRFTYGGCQANGNNFLHEDVCRITCAGVTEKDVFSRSFFEKQETDKSESVSIAIAVLLAVAIVITLAVLGYCFLKRRKRNQPRRQPAVNGTTAYSAEDTERLVYNATTKPI